MNLWKEIVWPEPMSSGQKLEREKVYLEFVFYSLFSDSELSVSSVIIWNEVLNI